ncbi:hypothetical protein [Phenylobacterium sp.]|uniref:hypothetical protein n=1 Tax=Phenylobacterium sp. TaxID=1871053 RepID=UPI0025CD6270|nr:hypothetical protein [Phenylobacterium sp.]
MPIDKRIAYAAVALALAATPALAQTKAPSTAVTPPPASADATPPTTTTDAAPPAGAASAEASGSNVSVTTGMSVKDNSGAMIGSITDVRTGADGKRTATIKMGADSFAVDTTSLAVAGGAATVNATQAEIKTMLKKK